MNLHHAYNRETFLKFVHGFISGFSPDIRSATATGLQTTKTVAYLGESRAFDLSVFELTHLSTRDARVKLAMDGFRVMKAHAVFRALIVYRSDKSDDWRLSLMTATLASNKKGGVTQTFSNPRRFSFFLGPNAKINTPNKFLVTQGTAHDFEDLQRRFSLEVVNKEFYRGISENYIKLVGGTIGSGRKKKTYEPILRLPSQSLKSPARMEFGVRLIGRIIFSWFLREKKGQNNIALMPKELLSSEAVRKYRGYYHSVLEPIFFEVLNKEHQAREERWKTKPFSHIPYLNGGLFSPQYDDCYEFDTDTLVSRYINTLAIPDTWFEEFFDLLESYNFTIDENTSFDEELSIDPEMLGRIFENLLAEISPVTGESARKSTGSFYTPRTIVDYMVDESLFLFLKQKTNIKEAKLRVLMSYDLTDDEQYPFDDSEKQKIIDALESLKLLDPACGSGAFPIGALQKIVFILQRIDPDARRWFAKQIANTSPELLRVIEREFKHKNFDYIRKLGIIRENIYGVDIQPIAIEISRLRCFLTLVVDERIDDSLPNRGIEPLPNLDFKFVAANSLIGLESGQTATEGLFKDQEGIARLRAVRDRYFTATNSERHRLQNEFSAIQKQMLDRMIQLGGKVASDETTRQLSLWEPFSNRASSWFDPEWMFGVDKFDVVIANPPYVDSETMTKDDEKSREILSSIYKSAKGNWDLFIVFIERGLQLLKDDATVTYIVPNKLIAARYSEKLRGLLLTKNILEMRDYSNVSVFKEVDVYPIVFLVQNNSDRNDVVMSVMQSETEVKISNKVSPTVFYKDIHWGRYFSPEAVLNVLLKMSKHPNLSSLSGGVSNASTVNEAYQIKEYLAERSPRTKECYKKLVNTGSIDRYISLWGKQKTQYIKNGYSEPIILDRDLNKISATRFQQTTSEKIIIAGMSKELECFYDTGEYLAGKSTTIILKDNLNKEITLKYILALLNSNLISFWFKKYFGALSLAGGYLQINNKEIEKIPIPAANNLMQKEFITLVDKILVTTKDSDYLENSEQQAKVRDYEKQIDQLVYKLYGLTPEEKEIVEKTKK